MKAEASNPGGEPRITRDLIPLHLVALGLAAAAAAFVVLPFWPWLVLAAWAGGLASGLLAPVARVVRGERRAAALLTVLLLVVIVLPILLALGRLVLDATALVRHLVDAGDARRMLEALVAPGGGEDVPADVSLDGLARFLTAYGARAWEILRTIAGATTHAIAGLAVFVLAAYARMAHGKEIYAWVERHTPASPAHLARMASAFSETGRGLFVGIGGAALAQATLATITYAALGVARAVVLGVLTFVGALIPGVGTAIVWLPVAAGLALTGRPGAGAILVLVGLALIGTIDNVLKPLLARYGRLDLPAALVFVAMLGGLFVVGPSGILLGPVVVRLAKEALVLAREEREARARRASAPPAEASES